MNRTRQQFYRRKAICPFAVVFLLFLSCAAATATASGIHNVVIIMSSDSSYSQRVAGRIRDKMDAEGNRSMIISAEDIASTPPNGKTLFISIGTEAVKKLHAFDSNAMTLRIDDRQEDGRKYTSTKSDLVTAQPACRHILLAKALNPDWMSIGVLSSIHSADAAAALTRCAIKHNVNLQVYAITDRSDLLKTLETAVDDNQVLLAINDPFIYNRHSIKNILLTAYRHRKPVIGYSESFVQAGAIAAVYSSPETAGDRAAAIVSDFFNNQWQFSRNINFTDDFSISTNERVAESLDIELPDTESIRENLIRMEKRP